MDVWIVGRTQGLKSEHNLWRNLTVEGCCGHSKNLRLDIKISCCAKYCIYNVLSCGDLLLSMCKKQWLSSLSHDYSRLRYDLHHVHFILVHVPYCHSPVLHCTSLLHIISCVISGLTLRNGSFFFTAGPCHWGKSPFSRKWVWYGDLSFCSVVLNWVMNFSM